VLSLIIPASNEEGWIGRCLQAVADSDLVPGGLEVIVVANGCRDRTADVARGFARKLPALQVLDLAQGSKPAALNAGDQAATGACRAYLDADCVLTAPVLAALAETLARDGAVYAGATPRIPPAQSWITRAYARFWLALPFNRTVAPGYGLYAVNAAGRARWGAFPALISDDTFVRLQFRPDERAQVAAPYDWPMVEGFAALVRVRRRQDAGVRELLAADPGLMQREGKEKLHARDILALALRDPVGFAVYAAVSLAVRLRPAGHGFTRGR
jgi:glycosyltransferase involved in cell wall biosynthesis